MSRDALDLFGFLGALNRRDLAAYDKLSDEAKKSAHPFVIMRWLAGTSDKAQIIRLNEFANKHMFPLGQEKALLFKLLAASCTGNVNRTSWIKGPGGNGTKLAVKAIMERYEVSTREAELYLELLEPADVVLCAEEAGWEKDQLKKLSTELAKDDGTGSTPKSSRKPKK